MSDVSCRTGKLDEDVTLRKIKYALAGALLAVLAGCGSEKGKEFIGSWIEVDAKGYKPTTMNISYDGEMFTVNRVTNSVGIDSKTRFDGKADSDTTLSFMGGRDIMRLKDGRVFYGNREFIKSP